MTFHKFLVGVVLGVAMLIVLPVGALVFASRDFQYGVTQVAPSTNGLISFARLEEVDQRLQCIMRSIHDQCVRWGGGENAHVNYVKGANLAGFVKVTTKSTIETVGVGTRTANPCNLPCTSGITTPSAFAAPVLVGIMLCAAALARRKSLCA